MSDEKIELTAEEKNAIQQTRKMEESKKKCGDEIKEVLKKYGFKMSVSVDPKIIFMPERE